jgi:peptide/nickel transport system ATP-binding protein
MAANEAPVLDIQHLCVDYLSESGRVHAVTDVSLTLRRGEVLGLAGESGSGKSTLAYAIARLLPGPAEVTGGQVLYTPRDRGGERRGRLRASDGPVDVLSLSARQLRTFRWSDLAVVFQSAMNALNPVMTVGTQIDDVLRAHQPGLSGRARAERGAELLKLVGIAPDRLSSYPHELSGGMRQRATIAIALALSPEIILMDEPTTALDVVVQHEILSEILRLRETLGFAVIFITHDLSLLLEIADQVAIMYAGRIVELATNAQLYQRPCHPYSYGLINSFPTLRGARKAAVGIPGTPPDLRAVPSGCAFHPRCPLAFAPCATKLPLLAPVAPDTTQQVACHLYTPTLRPAAPAPSELAAAYDAIAQGRSRA